MKKHKITLNIVCFIILYTSFFIPCFCYGTDKSFNEDSSCISEATDTDENNKEKSSVKIIVTSSIITIAIVTTGVVTYYYFSNNEESAEKIKRFFKWRGSFFKKDDDDDGFKYKKHFSNDDLEKHISKKVKSYLRSLLKKHGRSSLWAGLLCPKEINAYFDSIIENIFNKNESIIAEQLKMYVRFMYVVVIIEELQIRVNRYSDFFSYITRGLRIDNYYHYCSEFEYYGISSDMTFLKFLEMTDLEINDLVNDFNSKTEVFSAVYNENFLKFISLSETERLNMLRLDRLRTENIPQEPPPLPDHYEVYIDLHPNDPLTQTRTAYFPLTIFSDTDL